MPTYQYRCNDCQHEFEEFQSMLDEALTKCPECDGKIQRLISGGSGFLFKGSGFYVTDYRSSQYKKDASKDSVTPKKPGDKKTDAKTGSKTDSKSSSPSKSSNKKSSPES